MSNEAIELFFEVLLVIVSVGIMAFSAFVVKSLSKGQA